MSTTNDFIIMWDEYGLEGIVDITGKRQQYTMAVLGGTKKPDLPELRSMMVRARINGQRSYEIYAQKCDESITQEDIEEQFENNPQEIVDMIREKGVKLFSNRKCKSQIVIE